MVRRVFLRNRKAHVEATLQAQWQEKEDIGVIPNIRSQW